MLLLPEVATLSKDSENSKHAKWKDVNVLHAKLGNPGKDIIRATDAHRVNQCEDCTLVEAKQGKMNKKVKEKSKVPGEQTCIDFSLPSLKGFGGKHHRLFAVGKHSDMAWSYFLKRKDKTAETIVALVKDLRANYILLVKYICCNNPGKILP